MENLNLREGLIVFAPNPCGCGYEYPYDICVVTNVINEKTIVVKQITLESLQHAIEDENGFKYLDSSIYLNDEIFKIIPEWTMTKRKNGFWVEKGFKAIEPTIIFKI